MRLDRDLIVVLDISGPPILKSEEQDRQSPRPSYWKDILQVPEAGLGQPLIVVHTADHPGRTVGSSRAQAKESTKSLGAAPTNGNAFCGWDKPLSLIRLELSPEYLRRANAAFGSVQSESHTMNVSHSRDPKLLEVSAWLLDELNDGSTGAQLYADSLANVLALHLLRRYGTARAMTGYPESSLPRYPVARGEVASAIAYMHAHLAHPISLADLAQAAHVSPSHLARLFKRSTGLTPHQFLVWLRVEHARELLLMNTLSISEVAAQSGFADQSHLNRHLKRVYGVTPNGILNGR